MNKTRITFNRLVNEYIQSSSLYIFTAEVKKQVIKIKTMEPLFL